MKLFERNICRSNNSSPGCVAINNKIVGNIIYTKSKVVDKDDHEHEVITFGPISVLPSCQKLGIGSALIEHTTKIAQAMG